MSLRSKHSLALSLFLLIAVTSNFNPVSARAAFTTKSDLVTAVNQYCYGNDDFEETYGWVVVPDYYHVGCSGFFLPQP